MWWSMKKKIRDLTKEDKNNICSSHLSCGDCPLSFLEKGKSYYHCKDNFLEQYSEEEVEVDDWRKNKTISRKESWNYFFW